MTQDLLPFDGPITHQVLDSKENIVFLQKNVDLKFGVSNGEFQLPKRASGKYTIKVEVRVSI